MHRPDNWEPPFKDTEVTGKTCNEIYEAGADAVLIGLMKEGLYCYYSPLFGQSPAVPPQIEQDRNGYLVFIPEERDV